MMNSPVLSALHAEHSAAESRMGALLLDSGKLTPENAERVLRTQKELGLRFGEAAVRLGLVSEDDEISAEPVISAVGAPCCEDLRRMAT